MDNVVLFGFMGCGKSTVGALLARKTGRPLLDTDGYLEQKYGRSIPQIFASDGEETFRRMERQVCRELAGRRDLVVATGGGVILRPENVEALREAGAEVLGVASIFTYGLQKGLDRLAAANVVNHSLSNFDAVCEVAAEEGKIKPEDIERLKRFRANPSDESWITSK